MNLKDRTVLITGATGGIGHAIARALAGRGAKLILTGRRADVLEPLAAETGGRAIACDLTDRAAVEKLMTDCADIDVLVANAALPASGAIFDFTPEEIDRALDVNLRVPILMGRQFGDSMRQRGAGHLVFISSLAGKSAPPGSSLYSATKFGLRGFSLSLREDLHGTGVGVSTVFPGFIRDAGMFAESGAELPRGVGTKTPDDVAKAVLRAIDRNRGEIDVAPVPMKVGASLSGVVPGPLAAIQRRLSSHDLSASVAAGQKDKR
jgi:short-subunit dehydrogenase